MSKIQLIKDINTIALVNKFKNDLVKNKSTFNEFFESAYGTMSAHQRGHTLAVKEYVKEEFFRYYELDAYELKNNVFLKLLEEGKIVVTLESRIGKSGMYEGKYKNKNLVFKIKREYLEDLFTKVYSINTDNDIYKTIDNKQSNFYIFP